MTAETCFVVGVKKERGLQATDVSLLSPGVFGAVGSGLLSETDTKPKSLTYPTYRRHSLQGFPDIRLIHQSACPGGSARWTDRIEMTTCVPLKSRTGSHQQCFGHTSMRWIFRRNRGYGARGHASRFNIDHATFVKQPPMIG